MAKSNAGQKFPAPPVRSPFFDEPTTPGPAHDSGTSTPPTRIVSRPWIQWTQAITNFNNSKIPVTGSRASGEALNNALQVLHDLGLIDNQTTE